MALSIQSIMALEVLDSRGNPTVEATVRLSDGAVASFASPSGASVGTAEVVEIRDGGERYNGKGVTTAVGHINTTIAPALVGLPAADQANIDKVLVELDGTPDKSALGGNAILAVSVAVKKAVARASGKDLYRCFTPTVPTVLPVPLMNILNGGAHAHNNLDIQEFMIVPHGFSTFSAALQAGVEVFHALKKLLQDKSLTTAVGDEGGFAPTLAGGSKRALEFILSAIEKAGYRPQQQISLALDCAASEFYDSKTQQYNLPSDEVAGDAAAIIEHLAELSRQFPIVSLEDPCDENDWTGWADLTAQLGGDVQLVGDDLFVTNPARLKKGIVQKVANALLVKVNQIGTVTEMIEAVDIAHSANYNTVMSHRSGETEYADIADMAVALGCPQIKVGAPCRGERVAKYNQLLRIENQLGNQAQFAGQEGWR